MGGSGSGRYARKPKDDDTEFTDILSGESEQPKAKKKQPPKGKVGNFSTAEIAVKFDLLFSALAGIFGMEYTFEPADYQQEAAGFARLAQKFDVLGQVIVLFDPVLILAGLVKKFTSLKKKPGKEKTQDQPQPGDETFKTQGYAVM